MKRTSSQLKQLARESLAHRFSLPVMACVITFGIIMLVNMLPAALFPDTGNSISGDFFYHRSAPVDFKRRSGYNLA